MIEVELVLTLEHSPGDGMLRHLYRMCKLPCLPPVGEVVMVWESGRVAVADLRGKVAFMTFVPDRSYVQVYLDDEEGDDASPGDFSLGSGDEFSEWLGRLAADGWHTKPNRVE